MNPVSSLKELIRDPIEWASIGLPSAALVVGLFAYREQIYPELRHLPDPTKGNVLGAVIFVVVTLVVSLIIKRVSHDVLNWTYDTFARPRKLRAGRGDTWFDRAVNRGLLPTDDPKRSKYEFAIKELRKKHNPVLSKIELLEVQSKFSRSISLVLLIFAILVGGLYNNWLLGAFLLLSAIFMWKSFVDFRWEASEAAYGTLYDASPGVQLRA